MAKLDIQLCLHLSIFIYYNVSLESQIVLCIETHWSVKYYIIWYLTPYLFSVLPVSLYLYNVMYTTAHNISKMCKFDNIGPKMNAISVQMLHMLSNINYIHVSIFCLCYTASTISLMCLCMYVCVCVRERVCKNPFCMHLLCIWACLYLFGVCVHEWVIFVFAVSRLKIPCSHRTNRTQRHTQPKCLSE